MQRNRPGSGRAAPLLPLLLAALLTACGAAPEQPPEPTPAVPGPDQPDVAAIYADPLAASRFASPYRSAESALERREWMAAEVILAPVRNDPLPPTGGDRHYLAYLDARIAFQRGQLSAARSLLLALEREATAPALERRAVSLRRHMASLAGQYLESAQLSTRLMALDPEQDATLRRTLWRELQRAEPEQLRAAQQEAVDETWRGWLQLALVAHETGNPRLGEALRKWLNEHPGHPAARPLPGGLDYVLEQPAGNRRTVLILPLSGRLAPAAKAVRDGYLAAFYASRARGDQTPDLLVLDTERFPGPADAYRQAVQLGAGLVVGPLSKEAVAEVGLLPDRPVPVLALNRIDQELPAAATGALVQFSLSPTDEAQRIAELAFGQGARRAMLVGPRGAWGDRLRQALVQRWLELGGTVATSASYAVQEEHSSAIEEALNITPGRDRARAVRDMLAENIEFIPRRRQDIDVVFLLARDGAEARSIKPMLAYHYAGDLPVWGTASLHTGTPDPRDRDLQGVNLVEMPWLLGASPELRVAIAAGGTGSDSYTRLNALGADAYLLQAEFGRLRSGPDLLIRGNTGLLSLDPTLKLVREPQPATFDGARVIPR